MSRAAPAEKLIEHALDLVVKSEVEPEPAAGRALARLRQWIGESPDHAAAADEARRRWQMLGGMSEELREHFDEPVATSESTGRRNLLLSAAAMLGGAALAGRLGWQYWQAPVFTAAYRTQPLQLLNVSLPDARPGTQLALGADSAIGVRLHRQRRIVRLEGGELRCDVAHDAARPFQVLTRDARIEVLGTVFSLRDRGGALTVGVEHGRVQVALREGAANDAMDATTNGGPHRYGPPIILAAGELLDIRNGIAQPPRAGDAASLADWRDGWVTFQDTPLREALASVNAYRSAPIISTDSRVDAMRLTGRFPVRDAAGLLAVLPQVLPVTVRMRADGSAEIATR
ncbi:FecR family protein [Rhizobacter sp. OV335]|uniref:FecR family protein n=1 Tax=Rhizobacter sp. OV335 TaxID=1500264 RepID=UPI00091FF565|nr:FecR domain-containing protein [Rhizobacter sp. OV335]SHN31593.1 FecR family protein [Rhizobacter sp. OV335]